MLFISTRPVPTEIVSQVNVFDTSPFQSVLEHLFRELRMSPARRETPHVHDSDDLIRAQKIQKLFDGSAAVSDRVYPRTSASIHGITLADRIAF